eukprot:CAMPEP_0172889130 /NCGR_PEP_ID=MMETSP1075-20121228/138067_1 /TAXON_ID=2916 /ORGANISM="Ceratium fusus, Strain PA161109" /LENGTH=172 /DNA_ID=CAMNT_0013743119 /DNA_START=45 /DNA_END=563 /DNA_ORIENTATION=+
MCHVVWYAANNFVRLPSMLRLWPLGCHARLPVARNGWADSNWNWGSPNGEAHDLAMGLRRKLQTHFAREEWLQDLKAGKADIEELKLALGLCIQHAAREGIDGNGMGWQLMMDMAACKFEGKSGVEALRQDLSRLCANLSARQTSEAATSDQTLELAAANALTGMGFIERGL